MKKSLLIIIAGFTFSAAQSQGIADALQYAQTNITGTARFQAMSGAFGALGGDFSSINVNPAGSAIFANTQVGATLSNYNVANKSDYFGSKTSINNTTFDLSQGGAVFVFNYNDENSGWKKFVISIDYENANNFDNSLFALGSNPNHSVADYFLSYANPNSSRGGILLGALKSKRYQDLNYDDQQALIGFQAKIIKPNNPDDDNNDTYNSNVPAGGNYYQENYLESTGSNGKLAFNAGAQYKDRFYFGININTHFTDYVRSTSFYEENNNSQTNGVKDLTFNNLLHTFGDGFSFQLGAIAKITPSFRAGLAYESPTWYTLNDELTQTLGSHYYVQTPQSAVLGEAYSNSDITIYYAPYRLQTPGKWTGSLAYVFNKSGLISVDFGIKDYSKTHFRLDDDLNAANTDINNMLDYATEFRIGAEKRIKKWSLRAGYRFEQSPYKNGTTVGDLFGGSAGFGYNFGYTKLDLAYSYAQRKSQESFFTQGFTDSAMVKSVRNNISLTLLFDL